MLSQFSPNVAKNTGMNHSSQCYELKINTIEDARVKFHGCCWTEATVDAAYFTFP